MNDKIDFIITWLDSKDENWQKEKQKYETNSTDESNSQVRYRDWELLKYWFRAVEKNAPWVNNIFFVTCGQKPNWLNVNNKKLTLIDHKDYIPEEYLPTFNSNVIENFFNRIPNLSEKFVYFNDDVILADKVQESDFFEGNMVKDALIFNAVSVQSKNFIIEHTILNNLELLSKHFTKQQVEKNSKGKIYSLKYGKRMVKSFLLKPWKYFTGIENIHTAMPGIKSTWDEVWEKEEKELLKMASNRFRTKYDYNHWLFKYWQMFSGNFVPMDISKHKYYALKNENSDFIQNVLNKKYKIICLNDADETIDFEYVKNQIHGMLNKLYPNKSSFEK